jgi:hypothetical protein
LADRFEERMRESTRRAELIRTVLRSGDAVAPSETPAADTTPSPA